MSLGDPRFQSTRGRPIACFLPKFEHLLAEKRSIWGAGGQRDDGRGSGVPSSRPPYDYNSGRHKDTFSGLWMFDFGQKTGNSLTPESLRVTQGHWVDPPRISRCIAPESKYLIFKCFKPNRLAVLGGSSRRAAAPAKKSLSPRARCFIESVKL